MKSYLIILFALLFFQVNKPLLAQRKEVSKNIQARYNVNNSASVILNNRYGPVHVNTWDKNEVDINVEIRAWGSSEKNAAESLERIDVQHSQRGSIVRVETSINQKMINNDNNKGFEIAYTISMPANIMLDLSNAYGTAFLDNFNGELTLDLRYGKLKANRLTGPRAKRISISYGGIDAEEIENGSVDIRYSSGLIRKVGELQLTNAYSKMTFERVQSINLDIRYGGIVVEKEAGRIKGNLSYSDFKIALLHHAMVLDTRYAGSFNVEKISKNFEEIRLSGSYSSFYLNFEHDPAFTFSVNTLYGSFKNEIPNTQFRRQIEERQSAEYEGSINGGTARKVSVSTRYGSIRFR